MGIKKHCYVVLIENNKLIGETLLEGKSSRFVGVIILSNLPSVDDFMKREDFVTTREDFYNVWTCFLVLVDFKRV